jgi:hypothetical protein
MKENHEKRTDLYDKTTKPDISTLGSSLPGTFKAEDFPGGTFTVEHHYAGGGNHSTHRTMEEAVDAVKNHVVGITNNIGSMGGGLARLEGAVIPSVFTISHSSRPYPVASGTALNTVRLGAGRPQHEVSFDYTRQPVVHAGELKSRIASAEATQQRLAARRR